MNEAEYRMKNYGDRGGCYRPRRITPSEISIIVHMIRKPNSKLVSLFIQKNSYFKNIAKASLPPSMRGTIEIEEGTIRRSRRPRRIIPSEISIILQIIRKPNSIIVLLFIQNNS